MDGMTTSRRTFSRSLLLSAAALSLRSRVGLAGEEPTPSPDLSMELVPTLGEGELLIEVRLTSPGAPLHVIQPEGPVPLTVKHGKRTTRLDGMLPRASRPHGELVSRAGPRPRWVLLAPDMPVSLGVVWASWPEGLSTRAPMTVALELSLPSREGTVTLTGEAPIRPREA